MKIIYIVMVEWFFISHRSSMILEALKTSRIAKC